MVHSPITMPTTYISPYQRKATGPIVTITGSMLMGIYANKGTLPINSSTSLDEKRPHVSSPNHNTGFGVCPYLEQQAVFERIMALLGYVPLPTCWSHRGNPLGDAAIGSPERRPSLHLFARLVGYQFLL